MEFREAQQIAVMMLEDGWTAWAVDGFSVKFMLNGVLYEINKAKDQPNERSKSQ